MNLLARVLAVLTVGAVASLLLAQEVPREPANKVAAARAPFVFEAGDVELCALIERCAAYLQRNILVDDRELAADPNQKRGRPPRAVAPGAAGAAAVEEAPAFGPMVTLGLPVITDRDGCEELLSSLLWRNGLVMVPLDEPKSVYEVLSMNGARQREIVSRAVQRTPEQVLLRPTLRQFVTVVFEMQHTNAVAANNSLRPFFASSGGPGSGTLMLGNVGNQTAMVMTGPQDMVASALLLLKAADVPPRPEAQPDLAMRVEAMARQNEELLARIAALEKKLDKR